MSLALPVFQKHFSTSFLITNSVYISYSFRTQLIRVKKLCKNQWHLVYKCSRQHLHGFGTYIIFVEISRNSKLQIMFYCLYYLIVLQQSEFLVGFALIPQGKVRVYCKSFLIDATSFISIVYLVVLLSHLQKQLISLYLNLQSVCTLLPALWN